MKKPIRPIYRAIAGCVGGTIASLIFMPPLAPFFTLAIIPLSFIAMHGERRRYLREQANKGD